MVDVMKTSGLLDRELNTSACQPLYVSRFPGLERF